MIDTHVHFWNFNKTKDAWITDDMKLLQRDYLPTHFNVLQSENNVTGIVAVQADQSENETDFLLSLAAANSKIKGIVGWVDLQNKYVEERLRFYSQFPLIKGFRHIVQSEPLGFLQNKKFVNGIKALKDFGFTYDLLIYEHQLQDAIEFVSKFSGQKFIIDHCAKPAIRNKNSKAWEQQIRQISQDKNVFCKVSGLITEVEWNQWNENDLYPYLDIIFDAFGTDRLLFGSDWPVMLLSGNYAGWKNFLENYMKNYSLQEKEKVFSDNAIQFYNLYPAKS